MCGGHAYLIDIPHGVERGVTGGTMPSGLRGSCLGSAEPGMKHTGSEWSQSRFTTDSRYLCRRAWAPAVPQQRRSLVTSAGGGGDRSLTRSEVSGGKQIDSGGGRAHDSGPSASFTKGSMTSDSFPDAQETPGAEAGWGRGAR